MRLAAIVPALLLLTNAPGGATPPPAPAGLETLTPERLLADVAHLASPRFDGRLAGTRGYLAAARWAADRFGDAGLEPGGDDGDFLQWLPIETCEHTAPPRLRVAGPDDAWHDAVLGEDFTGRGFSGAGDVTAGVVFAGYGLSAPERGYDDYAGVDVAGRIVLCLKPNPGWQPDEAGWSWASSTPRAKAGTAAAHGARALLWVTPGRAGDDHPARGPIGSVLHGPGEQLADLPHLEISEALADRLLGGPGETRRLRDRIDADQQPRSRVLDARAEIAVQTRYDADGRACNVVGILPGADPELRDEVLILGAHLDHVGRQSPDVYFPGANDNASGAAAVLNLAAAFAASSEPPARTVVFVLFAGEESGLVGARWHAEHPARPLDGTVAMFNLDCVAHGDSIKVGGGESAPALWRRARELDAGGARLMVADTWEGGGADASPFFDRGVETLYWVTTNSYTHLHSVTDTPATLNGRLYAELVRLAGRTAWTVARGD